MDKGSSVAWAGSKKNWENINKNKRIKNLRMKCSRFAKNAVPNVDKNTVCG
ncbi:hypothetical protein [Desulfovibrio aminophilus]|uniref:hypothetical protein n=1 Tax=Desulfovibrio aminophilus TaxID=81425 RepID=UPI0033989D71